MASDNPLARATFQQLRSDGSAKWVELFQEGDLLLARDEHDPAGPLVLKRIEEIFVRQAFVIELVVRGRTIGTTAEHPFYVVERNDFVAAGEIEIGETFLSHDGQLVQLAGVNNTGRQETVYNFRIADFHTYFVGGKEWGFSVWVHNANYAIDPTRPEVEALFEQNRGRLHYDTNGPTSGLRGEKYGLMAGGNLHAETGAMAQAFEAGQRGGIGRLLIDTTNYAKDRICSWCLTEIKRMAARLELDVLEVGHVTRNGIVEYRFDKKGLLPISQGGTSWQTARLKTGG